MAYLYRIAAYLLLAFAPIQLVYADFIAPEIVSGNISIYQPEKEGFFDNLGPANHGLKREHIKLIT